MYNKLLINDITASVSEKIIKTTILKCKYKIKNNKKIKKSIKQYNK